MGFVPSVRHKLTFATTSPIMLRKGLWVPQSNRFLNRYTRDVTPTLNAAGCALGQEVSPRGRDRIASLFLGVFVDLFAGLVAFVDDEGDFDDLNGIHGASPVVEVMFPTDRKKHSALGEFVVGD